MLDSLQLLKTNKLGFDRQLMDSTIIWTKVVDGPAGIISHLDVEAESSVFVWSHLDQDQIIMRDDSI